MKKLLSSFLVLVIAVPCFAGTVPYGFFGPSSVCEGDTVVYESYTAFVPDHTYDWTCSGGTIISGMYPGKVSVVWTAPGGTIDLYEMDTVLAPPNDNYSSLSVAAYATPVADAGTDTTICQSGCVSGWMGSDNNPGYNWNWSHAQGSGIVSNAGQVYLSACPPSTVTYYLTISDTALACPNALDSTTVTVNPAPTATISGGGIVCEGDPIPPIQIDFTGTGPWNFSYFMNGSPVSAVAGSSPYLISLTGDGICSPDLVSDALCPGTFSPDTAFVRVNPLPTATISGGGPFCLGDTACPPIVIDLTGTPPWDLTLQCNGAPQNPFTNITSSPFLLTACVDCAWTVLALNDANCQADPDSLTGTAVWTALAPPAPTFSQQADTLMCDSTYVSYQWYLDGNILPNDTNPSLVMSGAGSYLLSVVGNNGCEGNSTVLVVSGLRELGKIDFNIYPNPASSELTLTTGEEAGAYKHYRVCDLLGKDVIPSTTITSTAMQINIAGLTPGIYLLSVATPNRTVTKRFVKK